MVSAKYVPQRGDVAWIDVNPRSGHEQSGRRPAIVLSPRNYNDKTGQAIFCPVTSRTKGYPFEVPLPDGLPVMGTILSDQVKSLDWRSRNIELICALPADTILEVLDKLVTLFQ